LTGPLLREGINVEVQPLDVDSFGDFLVSEVGEVGEGDEKRVNRGG